MRRVVVISDIQAPLHDKKMVEAVTLAVKGMKLGSDDLVAVVGDECDSTSLGRWVRSRHQEYTDNLQTALDTTHNIIKGFREAAPKTPIIVQRSNHTTDRIENYIGKYAPALATLRGLDWASLMRYDEIDVQLRLWPTPIAPGWLMAHGDELSGSSRIAGGLAMGLSRRFGKSVVCGHCFDDSTEILTPQGWVSHEKLTDDSIVLTMNKETGSGEWQQVEAVHRHQNTEPLIHVEAWGLNLAVTGGHGLVVNRKHGFGYPTAGEAFGKAQSIPLALMHSGESLPISDDEIRFIAWVMAEGSIDKHGGTRIAQSENGTASLEAVLDGCGYDYSKVLRYKGGEVGHGVWHNQDAYRYGLRNGRGAWRDLLGKYVDGQSKNPTRDLAGMDARQALVFLHEYVLADGFRMTGNAYQLNTADKAKVDFFQELAVRSGQRSSITKRKNGGHYTISINARSSVRTAKEAWVRREHTGTVWCVTVPNGTLVVRREGKTAITQNSHKAGIQHDHDSHSGKITRYLFGMEVGSLMSLPKAQYLKSGGANWTHGFGVLYQHGNHVTPNLVPIVNRGFTLEGKHHSW